MDYKESRQNVSMAYFLKLMTMMIIMSVSKYIVIKWVILRVGHPFSFESERLHVTLIHQKICVLKDAPKTSFQTIYMKFIMSSRVRNDLRSH